MNNSRTSKRWATRKIRNGRVKIGGIWYYPSKWYKQDKGYDGRLDGQWWVFGRYPDMLEHVALWGSLDYSHGKREFGTDPNNFDMNGDGQKTINWSSWFCDIPTMQKLLEQSDSEQRHEIRMTILTLKGIDTEADEYQQFREGSKNWGEIVERIYEHVMTDSSPPSGNR